MFGSTHRLLVVSLLVLFVCAAMTEAAGRRQRGRGRAAAAPQDETGKALVAALEDERKAQAFYKAILARHGQQVMPFAHIVQAEGMHESALLGLMKQYNVPVPTDKYLASPPEAPATVAEAIRQSIQYEKDNVALYDRLLKSVKQEDIRAVMNNLRSASLDRHLPALERHVGGGQGRGPGAGWQGGNGQGGGGCCPACCGVGGQAGQGRGTGWGAGQGGGRGPGWQGGRGGGRGAGAPGGPGRGQGWRGG